MVTRGVVVVALLRYMQQNRDEKFKKRDVSVVMCHVIGLHVSTGMYKESLGLRFSVV